jgi:hypothetical protein
VDRHARKQLVPGLYRVTWRGDEGTSLAAVGMTSSGERWLAPCNWLGPVTDDDVMFVQCWRDVESVSLIEVDRDAALSHAFAEGLAGRALTGG